MSIFWLLCKGQNYDTKDEDVHSQWFLFTAGGQRAEAVALTSWRTYRYNSLKESDLAFGLAEDVYGLAGVVGKLFFLDGDDPKDGVGVLVVKGEMGDSVMLKSGTIAKGIEVLN